MTSKGKPIRVTEAIYHSIVQSVLQPYLTAAGLKRTGRYWFYRREGDTYSRLSLGLQKSRITDEGWIDMHLCVGFYSLTRFVSGWSLLSVDPKKPCAMPTTLLGLDRSLRGKQWHLMPSTSAQEIGQEILDAIREHGLPFFARYGTLEKITNAWESGIAFNLGRKVHCYLAAAYCLRGEPERALAYINACVNQYDPTIRTELDNRRFCEAFREFLQGKIGHHADSRGM